MKTIKFMAVALCAAACVTTTAFAEDDFGIESPSPIKIADPVNPQPGALCTAYLFGNTSGEENWNRTISQLKTAPSIKTYVDLGKEFTRDALPGDMQTNLMKWEGFIKCKRAGRYSFSFIGPHGGQWFTFQLNGVDVFTKGEGQKTVAGTLKVGWNKIVMVVECKSPSHKLQLKYKPNESLSEPRPLTPAMLFHDQKPDEGDW